MKRRLAINVRGIVQGVGFRPYVHGLASRFGLGGMVRNEAGEVLIHIEGEADAVDQFLAELAASPPPLAQIDAVSWKPQEVRGDGRFEIIPSRNGDGGAVFISPDVATCDACLRELFDPADRRYRYPFLNCTDCGPRLTIITGAPYDRARTTMAGFAMCPACRAEYDDPANRRFHAQPTACPACGPRLALHDRNGRPVSCDDPLREFSTAILRGHIGALKGLGGYHLVCDTRNEAAVGELRSRKHRDEKPFAIMVPDVAAAGRLCAVSPEECALLCSPRRPIVLLRRRADDGIASTVAPGNPMLGVMLPYTPLHHLLMNEVRIPLVMTSGNRSDEPIAHDNADAFKCLAGIADLFLIHDRPIHVRCDDSVTRVVAGEEAPIRRSRGYAPQPVRLPFECPGPILAVGGQLKGTFAIGRVHHGFLSHHLGDLDHFAAYQAFQRDVRLYEQLFNIRPAVLAHDLHPDYAVTRYALSRSAEEAIPTIAVQHHHAHMAACMAEHGLTGPVIGVAFDGTGYGTDGAVWGGEFLTGDYRGFRRAAHLRYVRMPGGDRAIREPWRMALAHLLDAGVPDDRLLAGVPAAERRLARSMIDRGFNSPWTSSAGRLFDAVAAIIGLRDRVSFEGQAAIELEWAATRLVEWKGAYPFEVSPAADGGSSLVVDTRPLIRAVGADAAAEVDPGVIAHRFHSALVEMMADVCGRIRSNTGLNDAVLSGGVFMNAVLSREAVERLSADGFKVYRHRLVPPNDGGLSLGQVAVAAAQQG